jgi:hypothetical protein
VNFATRDPFFAPAELPPLAKDSQQLRDTSCAIATNDQIIIYQIANDL